MKEGKIFHRKIELTVLSSFSEVLKAQKKLKKTDISRVSDLVAIKCIKPEGVAISKKNAGMSVTTKSNSASSNHLLALQNKEVFALKVLKPHPNIIQLIDVFVDPPTSRICIVTELM